MSDRRPSRVEELRAEFDASFAAVPAPGRADRVALLSLRAGGELVALRVLEVSGLFKARTIVPVPSARPELVGLCGVRGAVLPVYGLARLLRIPEEPGAARWMVLAGPRDGPVALAFGGLEGHLVVAAEELQRAAPGQVAVRHVAEVVQRERPLPVVSVPSLLRAIMGD